MWHPVRQVPQTQTVSEVKACGESSQMASAKTGPSNPDLIPRLCLKESAWGKYADGIREDRSPRLLGGTH